MAKHNNKDVSNETIDEALIIAKKTQKSGQTKDQTRLIAQGIQKGIADYKKSAKAKSRQADKAQKKQQRQKQLNDQPLEIVNAPIPTNNKPLPWILLIASWAFFAFYLFTLNAE